MNTTPHSDDNRPAITLSFLIANWNGGTMLRECLDSIAGQATKAELEVIVVDNGSTDASCDLPHFDRPGWHLERLEQNCGFATANNMAFRLSRGTFIALINNDIQLMPEWTEQILTALRAAPAAGSAACRILQHDRPAQIDSAGFEWHTCAAVSAWQGEPAERFCHGDHRPFGAVASAAVYRRRALEDTGLFRDPFFAYYEDTDLAVRLRLFGHHCVYVNDAVALHRGSATGGPTSRFRDYHLRRNIEYVYWTNMLGSMALRHLPAHVAYETVAFCRALCRGRGRTFLAAKGCALRHSAWIWTERHALREKLKRAGRWPTACGELAGRIQPTWSLLLQRARLPKHKGDRARPNKGVPSHG